MKLIVIFGLLLTVIYRVQGLCIQLMVCCRRENEKIYQASDPCSCINTAKGVAFSTDIENDCADAMLLTSEDIEGLEEELDPEESPVEDI